VLVEQLRALEIASAEVIRWSIVRTADEHAILPLDFGKERESLISVEILYN